MENLGMCADITSGAVEIVSPLTLTSTVKSLLASRMLATDVRLSLYISPELQWTSTFDLARHGPAQITRDVGAAHMDSDLTFAFAGTAAALAQHKELEGKPARIQLQLQYTHSNGDVVTQVVTKTATMTAQRDVAEADISSHVVAIAAVQQGACLAQQGDYLESRITLINAARLLQRGMHHKRHQKAYMDFIVQAEKLDQFMREAQAQQQVFGSSTAIQRDDQASMNLYQMKSVSVRALEAHA
jgi:hypothetical protein